jgi:hypothetical protein
MHSVVILYVLHLQSGFFDTNRIYIVCTCQFMVSLNYIFLLQLLTLLKSRVKSMYGHRLITRVLDTIPSYL